MDGPTLLAVTVRRFRFRGEDGWTVAECRAGDGDVTVVGYLPPLLPGERLQVVGEWAEHPRYGRQFRAHRWELPPADDPEALISLIAGAGVEGVGPELARRIVEHLGADALREVLRDPDRLLEIRGIGPARRDRIVQAIAERQQALETASDLQRQGLPPELAWRLYAHLGPAAPERLRADPLGTLTALPGLSFAAADAAALRAGADPADPRRLEMALKLALEEATWDDGHVFMPVDALAARALRMLARNGPVAGDDMDPALAAVRALERLADAGEVVLDDQRVYLPVLYEAECDLADHVARLLVQPAGPPGTGAAVRRAAAELPGWQPDPAQLRAVAVALSRPLTIITGGPGTGKTATVRALIHAAELVAGGCRVVLAAPTGRAARRLAELTGRQAATLHRLLEAAPAGEGQETLFRRDEDHPLEGDLLVVDEASMLDVLLAASLFRAVPDGMRVVLVGDVDQLPPVGPGNVLRDLMACGVPSVRLERVFRQEHGSGIVAAAHAVRSGRMPEPGDGFRWDLCRSAEEAAQRVVETAARLAAEGIPLTELQVLAPVRRGPAGVDQLNRRLQDRLNPGQGLRVGDQEFRLGDKVMCIRNNYEKGRAGIFNGHVGLVTAVDLRARAVEVDFDGERVRFEGDELADLRLGYCATVHKSQGSEFDVVILCLHESHRPLLRRKLLYTGLTRARRGLILVASPAAVRAAIADVTEDDRCSALAERVDKAQPL